MAGLGVPRGFGESKTGSHDPQLIRRPGGRVGGGSDGRPVTQLEGQRRGHTELQGQHDAGPGVSMSPGPGGG